MNGVTLDQLKVFITVAEEGSFSAAARRLHRAQSAVSYAVGNLERLLEVSLFDRSRRKPALTEEGRALLSDSQSILEHVDQLRARSRLMAQGTEPRVSLVVDVMFPMPVLTEALWAFRERFPTVSLRLQSEALGAVAQLVVEGTCQLGISGPLKEFPRGLERRSLTSIPMITVAAPEHPLAQHEGPLPTSMLTNHIQLVLTDRSNLTQGTDYGVLSNHTWRLADLSTKHTFLKAGFGWGNMPAHVVQGDLQKERLVRIYPAEWQEEPQIPQFMIYRSSNPPGPAGQWLLERLAAAFNGKSHE